MLHFVHFILQAACQCIVHACQGSGTVPWRHVQHMIASAYYGGRITDTGDRRTFDAIVQKYFSAHVLEENWSVAGVSIRSLSPWELSYI